MNNAAVDLQAERIEYLEAHLENAQRGAGDNLDAWRKEHQRAEALAAEVKRLEAVVAALGRAVMQL